MKKNNLNFKNMESLHPVVAVINDAAYALDDKKRTQKESAIPDVVFGGLGAGVGGAISFTALYGLGTVGLSGAGIMSGLAAAGGIVGAGAAAGIFVLAAPVAVLAGTSVAISKNLKHKQLKQERERLYKEALTKHQALIVELDKQVDASKERIDYLSKLNVLLEGAIRQLKEDINNDK